MKTKKFLAYLLAVTVVGASMPAVSAIFPKISITANAEETLSHLKYTTLADGTIEIVSCDTTVTTVEIPAEIDGKKVTSIGNWVFEGCSELTSVTIPDSVTNIGNYAFIDCSGLTSITIPDSVISIGQEAFKGCSALTSINISDSLTSIGKEVFYGCSALTSITIPNSVTSIGKETFANCLSLTSVTIPGSVTYIGSRAFYNTPWLENKQKDDPFVMVNSILIDGTACSGDVVIPDSAVNIGEFAFGDCSGLTSITIPDSVTSIGMSAFYGCSGLSSITVPESVTSICTRAL